MSKILVGVDEAGRGPVLGPLVMVAVAVKEEDLKKLEWVGVKDSKLLTPLVREELFERLKDIVHDFRIEVIEPDAIDLTLQEENNNLNWLEAETSARLVSQLQPDRITIDCPSVNVEAYKVYFSSKLSAGILTNAQLVVEHKADLNHLEVAAASIIAKVIRDRQIEHLKKEIGIDFGSGYMSDPKTQIFLREHYDTHPELFRRQWKSYQKVIEEKKQSSLDEF
tara:strand:- start:425 stop:1093 length:669 start_codon:yes stop_codon:yes gene_type:complete